MLGVPEHRGPFRIGTVACDVNKLFVFNGEFVAVCNPQYFVDGEVRFPVGTETADGTYRTVTGPSCSDNSRIYANTNENFRLAFRRITASRVPEVPGYHQLLFSLQSNFVSSKVDFISKLCSLYTPFFDDYQGAENEATDHHADTHPKRELRIQGYEKLLARNDLGSTDSLWAKSVLVKIKPAETAKVDKYPRVIGDYGVEASLLGFRLTDIMKSAQSATRIDIYGGTLIFCKSPDPLQLLEFFNLLFDPPGRFIFLYFSDDSCLSIRDTSGALRWFNLDISSCDASHGTSMFAAYLRLFPKGPARDDAHRLIRQCLLPIRIVSRNLAREVLFLQCIRPFLYSGSTITTSLNNLACILIILSLVERPFHGILVNNIAVEIVDAAERVGYILTGCEPLEYFEDLQFLKNSPVRDTNGDWQPLLNFGVLLRASGRKHGDHPGFGDLEPRGNAFQYALIHGCYPHVTFPVFESMKTATGITGPPVDDPAIKELLQYKSPIDAPRAPFCVDVSSFCLRYRLTMDEYHDLLCVFAVLTYGYVYHSIALTKILGKDYGLATVVNDATRYLCVSYHSSDTEAFT